MSREPRRKAHGANRKTGNIDIHVGERLRQRRVIRRLSLDELASNIGVSAQQLQKYEAGHNRITAARLYRCAEVLDVPVSTFYIGLPQPRTDRDETPTLSPVATGHVSDKEVWEILRIFSSIRDPNVRRKLIELVDSFAVFLRG